MREPAKGPARSGGRLTPLVLQGRDAAVWGHGIAATMLALVAVTLPFLAGPSAVPWTLVTLLPALWMGLQAWGHAVVRVETGLAGMRIRVPDEMFGVFLPPVRDHRFTWADVEDVRLLEGVRARDPGLLARALEPFGGVLIVRAGGRVSRLTWAMARGQLLDLAELISVGAGKPVIAQEPFLPGSPDPS